MAQSTYHKGKYRDEALSGPYRCSVVGDFIKDTNDPRKTDAVEIKYWELPAGPTKHPAKTQETVEITLILEGRTGGFIGDRRLILEAGDYVVIKPRTQNNIVELIHAPTKGLTIKAPSDPKAKKVSRA